MTDWNRPDTAPKDGSTIIYFNGFGEIGFCHWSPGADETEIDCWWDEERDDSVTVRGWLPRDALPAIAPPNRHQGEG